MSGFDSGVGVGFTSGHQAGPGARKTNFIENGSTRAAVGVHGPTAHVVGNALIKDSAIVRIADVSGVRADGMTCRYGGRRQRRRCRSGHYNRLFTKFHY